MRTGKGVASDLFPNSLAQSDVGNQQLTAATRMSVCLKKAATWEDGKLGAIINKGVGGISFHGVPGWHFFSRGDITFQAVTFFPRHHLNKGLPGFLTSAIPRGIEHE